MTTRGWVAAALLAALAAPAAAQTASTAPAAGSFPRHMLELGAGLDAPLSQLNLGVGGGAAAANGDPGIATGARYFYALTPRLRAGAGLEYLDRAATLSGILVPIARASAAGETLDFMGFLRYALRDRGVRPFLLAGGGVHRTTLTVDARPHDNTPWPDTGTFEARRLVDGTVWGPAATARAGVEVPVDEDGSGVLSLEAGWTWLAPGVYDATAQGRTYGIPGVAAPINFLTVEARYGWRF